MHLIQYLLGLWVLKGLGNFLPSVLLRIPRKVGNHLPKHLTQGYELHASFCRKLANFSKTYSMLRNRAGFFKDNDLYLTLTDNNLYEFIWNFPLMFSDMLVNYLFIHNSLSFFLLLYHSLLYVGRRCDRLRSFPLQVESLSPFVLHHRVCRKPEMTNFVTLSSFNFPKIGKTSQKL